MSEILDTYAAEAQARKYRDMAATEFLTSHGYKWEQYEWVAPDGLTPRQLSEQRAALLEALEALLFKKETQAALALSAEQPSAYTKGAASAMTIFCEELRAAIALAQGDAA